MGVVKADLKRMLTKIAGAIGYKHDPKMRQELLAAFEEDIISVMDKHGYIAEAEDHEVGMAMGQLEALSKAIQELEDKVLADGEERDLPGWIQSHITSAYEYIKQANDNFHELEENTTPSTIGGMGEVQLPTETDNGSGDVPIYTKSEEDEENEETKLKNEMNKLHKTFESFISESVNESFEVIYSDGMSQMKKFRNERQALDFMKKEIASNKKLRDIAVYKPGMHSTTQTELVVKFWGDGSYLDNVSKKDADLAAKKLDEAYDGNMSDFKYEFPMKFEEATGNSTKAIKKMAKKGKGKFEVRTSTYMSEPEMKLVADAMGMELVSYEKSTNIAISVFESVEVNEGLHPELKKAQKAIKKGKTVYGENVRFPGRFKIVELGNMFATVDYEDGTKPMEMAAMNIRIDSLQFESLELDDAIGLKDLNVELAESVNESMSSFYFNSPSEFDAFSSDAPAKGETKYLVMANNRANFNGQEIRLEGTVRFGSTSKKQIIGIFNDEESATEAYKKAMKKPEGTFVSFTMGTLVGATKFRSQYTETEGYLATAKVK